MTDEIKNLQNLQLLKDTFEKVGLKPVFDKDGDLCLGDEMNGILFYVYRGEIVFTSYSV